MFVHHGDLTVYLAIVHIGYQRTTYDAKPQVQFACMHARSAVGAYDIYNVHVHTVG